MSDKHRKKERVNKTIMKKTKYIFFFMAVALVSVVFSFNLPTKSVHAEEILVYKSPTCGCCKKWVTHLESNGFNVKTKDMRNLKPIKDEHGVERQFQSCHTAKIGKYFIEGHVPASDIKRLLKEKPDIKGLSVPGMVMGSPGMEGHRKDKYDVVAIDKDNKASIYSSY